MSYANLEAFEGSLSSETTLDLARPSRQVIITNDSGSTDMTFKFNVSETAATLKPTETISVYMRTKSIILNAGASVNYRVWVFG